MEKKLKWYIVNKEYVSYLQKFDAKVENVEILQYKEIEKYRQFANDKERKAYIALLDIELNLINEKADKIRKNAVKLYKEKINHPNSRISKRCCNFKYLEEKSKIFK